MFGADDSIDSGIVGEGLAADTSNQARNEAIEALTALGYSPSDALKAVKRADITDDMDSGAILKATLKVIGTL
jgi:Holliday junction DNA helicase RuvA